MVDLSQLERDLHMVRRTGAHFELQILPIAPEGWEVRCRVLGPNAYGKTVIAALERFVEGVRDEPRRSRDEALEYQHRHDQLEADRANLERWRPRIRVHFDVDGAPACASGAGRYSRTVADSPRSPDREAVTCGLCERMPVYLDGPGAGRAPTPGDALQLPDES